MEYVIQYIDMQKPITDYNKKIYNKNKESLYLQHFDANGWTMSQKLPVNGFKWGKNTTEYNESFKRIYS